MIEYDPNQNDTIKTTLTLLDRLLDENENLIRKHCGLDRDDVIRMTAKMKRENFLPTQIGIHAIIEFLESGFVDCGPSDYCRWGMNGQTVVPAAEAHPKLSVEERSVVNQWGNRSIQHVINLATVAEERKRLQNANKRKDTVEEDTRGRYDKRSAQGAKKKGSGKRAKHVKARTSNH